MRCSSMIIVESSLADLDFSSAEFSDCECIEMVVMIGMLVKYYLVLEGICIKTKGGGEKAVK
jgi:hypothetical protein